MHVQVRAAYGGGAWGGEGRGGGGGAATPHRSVACLKGLEAAEEDAVWPFPAGRTKEMVGGVGTGPASLPAAAAAAPEHVCCMLCVRGFRVATTRWGAGLLTGPSDEPAMEQPHAAQRPLLMCGATQQHSSVLVSFSPPAVAACTDAQRAAAVSVLVFLQAAMADFL